MDLASVEKDLQRRIDQSREWLSDKPAPITGLNIRSYPCLAVPVRFIDYRKSSGVLFRLEFNTPSGTFEAYVELDIMPTRSVPKNKEKNPDPPFVAASAFNPETKKRDLITWEFINILFYKSSLETSIEEWYKGWLFKALIHKNVAKIFKDNAVYNEKTSSDEDIPISPQSYGDYLPTNDDFEYAFGMICSSRQEIPIDSVLDQIENNITKSGYTLKTNWRLITERNIEIWLTK